MLVAVLVSWKRAFGQTSRLSSRHGKYLVRTSGIGDPTNAIVDCIVRCECFLRTELVSDHLIDVSGEQRPH